MAKPVPMPIWEQIKLNIEGNAINFFIDYDDNAVAWLHTSAWKTYKLRLKDGKWTIEEIIEVD